MNYLPPKVTRPARLNALPKLPIFLDLQRRRVVVAGGGEAAAWKAELLAAAGASVTVFAEALCEELEALIGAGYDITWYRRSVTPADLDDAWLLLVESGEDDAIAALRTAARRRGVLVNVIDRPDFCDFQFGTIVNRAPVVIGISTDGAAPIIGQAIRRRIEAVLPKPLGEWVAAAKRFRGRLKEILPAREQRRQFWEALVDVTFAARSEQDARPVELERLAQDIRAARAEAQAGEVIFVGAGPGDPELVTMKAVRELQAADVIVYDRLVSPAILELGRREARRILVGKKGHGAACAQSDINALLVSLGGEGRRVVRLKGGDPAIFARLTEELDACRNAGVATRIVPGISAANAAAAALGISLTQRASAQRVQFVTGHDREGNLPADVDFDALADPRATTVVYMGGGTAAELAERLIARGLPGRTPVAIAAGVSQQSEHIEVRTLDALRAGLTADGRAPVLLIIGDVVGSIAPRAARKDALPEPALS